MKNGIKIQDFNGVVSEIPLNSKDPSFSYLIFSAIEYNFLETLPLGSLDLKIFLLLYLIFKASESASALAFV